MSGVQKGNKPNSLGETATMIKEMFGPTVLVVAVGMQDMHISGVVGIGTDGAYLDDQELPPADYIVLSVPRKPTGFAPGVTVLEM